VRGFCGDWPFFDVGTPADYLRTSRAFSTSATAFEPSCRVAPTAHIAGSVLWDDVEVGASATLTDCIVTDGVHVPAGAAYERAILIADEGAIIASRIEGDFHD
jgi:NDP-sugar pyrophosphorylase family protein